MSKQSLIVVDQGQLSSDPASPAAGYSTMFPKTDGKWYIKNSDGTKIEITNAASLTRGQVLAMLKGFATQL